MRVKDQIEPLKDEIISSFKRNETILHLLEEGKTQKEVADFFGISLARVGQIYRRSLK